MTQPRTALVLAGGGARGAYEAGVVRYLREEFPSTLGEQPRIDILSGTSIGAVNACFLAATAHTPELQGRLLADVWLSLRIEDVFHWSFLRLAALPLYLLRRVRMLRLRHRSWRISDFLYPEALARVIRDRVDWDQLHVNVRSGAVGALTVTATDLGTGRAVVFIETANELPVWSRDPQVEARPRSIAACHALASSAIPLLFRPVFIEGSWFSDGSILQNTPLAPAIRLGADRVLVVGLRHQGRRPAPRIRAEGEVPSTGAQLGGILNALTLDHADYDLDRLRRLNQLLEYGEQSFGPDFRHRLAALGGDHLGTPIRRVRDLVIRPSQDLGLLAQEYAKKQMGKLRPGTLAARLLRLAAASPSGDDQGDGAADLASYLLFDREYAAALMAMGFDDARKQRDALVEFFRAPVDEAPAATAQEKPEAVTAA
ncbi:MAG: patatin-like phospholipase family protein [Anaeromyxobacteraceae bacterium]